jgi:hypothetical protein
MNMKTVDYRLSIFPFMTSHIDNNRLEISLFRHLDISDILFMADYVTVTTAQRNIIVCVCVCVCVCVKVLAF